MDQSQQAAAPAPDAGLNAADAIHVAMRFMRMLRRRWKLMAACVLAAGLLGGLYYFTATRIYEAKASVLVLQTGHDVWTPGSAGDPQQQALIPTYESLFSSTVVLEGAVKNLLELPPELRADLAAKPLKEWVETLRQGMSVGSVRRANVIQISYQAKSPEVATAIVDSIVSSYLAFIERNHRDVSAEIVKILNSERIEVEGQLNARQADLLNRKRAIGDIGIRESDTIVHPVVQQAVKLNDSLMDVREERANLQATWATLQRSIQNGDDVRQHLLAVEPTIGRDLMASSLGLNQQDTDLISHMETKLIQDRAKLKALEPYYGHRNHRVVELTESVRQAEQYLANYQNKVSNRLASMRDGRLANMLQGLVSQRLEQAKEREAQLTREYRSVHSRAVQLNDQLSKLAMAEHGLSRLRDLHDTLVNRISSIDLNQNKASVRVEPISPAAASEKPVSPRLAITGLLCLLAGCGGGAVLIYVLDVLEDRFRSPEELKEQLNTQLLAMVRQFEADPDGGADALQVHVRPDAIESEAFRTLRTTLSFSGETRERISVTSSEPGDGKTTMIANLGASYAQTGRRTLIIDADMRRPGLSKMFDVRRLGGLSEVLRSTDDLSEVLADRIVNSGVENLDLLPCGPKPSDPTELLARPRFSELLEWANLHYDQVLIDGPPVLVASDAGVIGRLTDGVVLVVQPEKNHRQLVLRAADSLRSMNANLIGVVANRIRDEQEGGYYGYGYGYGYGYHEDDNDLPDVDAHYDDPIEEMATESVASEPGPAQTVPMARHRNDPPRRRAA